mgnify:CR=1 FL=1|tara:strand:+ start:87 stop:281 length:195 start_codon:yes stop_codon:yes gene_type:complete
MNKTKNEKYRVCSHKFMGSHQSDDYESYTYEITFNKSLAHTGSFTGIEDGLNSYVKKKINTSKL